MANEFNIKNGFISKGDSSVEGLLTTQNLRVTSGATNGYVLTSDVSGNATWGLPSNIYNSDGTLLNSRFINLNGEYIAWQDTTGNSEFGVIIDDGLTKIGEFKLNGNEFYTTVGDNQNSTSRIYIDSSLVELSIYSSNTNTVITKMDVTPLGVGISGDTVITNGLTANTLNISSTPTIQSGIPTNHLTRDDTTGNIRIEPSFGPISYGLFSQTGDSQTVSATTTESSLLDGGVGTLSVPSNAFKIGDSFRGALGGIIANSNGETIRVRLKSGSVILADSGVQTLSQHTNDVFKLGVDFTIRNIGGTGTASIITLGVFQTAKKNSSNLTGFGFEFTNNTTFDTTVSNTLDITVEWGSNSTGNIIKSQVFILNKTF